MTASVTPLPCSSAERSRGAAGQAFAAMFGSLLEQAAELGAADIHLEPLTNRLQVRMRVDGRLRVVATVTDDARRRRMVEVVKRACGFDLGLLGTPQDARFSIDSPAYDFRATLVPLLEGEKVVLRLLPRGQDWSLQNYPLREDAKADLRTALQQRDGLVVVSGPTGSGKSTLLYSGLASLDRVGLNVQTVEDPVEYRLDGVCQSQVDRGRGATFARLLRGLMRADPDVILVGEIRDEETAEVALHAASTGHLVLTTVHAVGAADIEQRLQGLGVDPALYRANLRWASAQRLLPKLCPHCRVADPDGAALVHQVLDLVADCQSTEGCDRCGGTGVKGRVLLFEWQASRRQGASRVLEARGGLLEDTVAALRCGDIDARTACGS